MVGGWTAILVTEWHHTEEAPMDRQLTVIAGMDGGYLAKLIHEMTRPGCEAHQTLPNEAGIEAPLRANFS